MKTTFEKLKAQIHSGYDEGVYFHKLDRVSKVWVMGLCEAIDDLNLNCMWCGTPTQSTAKGQACPMCGGRPA